MDEDENFIIDEEAAPVVKQIYNLCLAGNGPTKIAPVSYTHLDVYKRQAPTRSLQGRYRQRFPTLLP